MQTSTLKILLISSTLGLAACVSTSTPSVRTWVDPKTAVSVTAQDAAIVFGHDELIGRQTMRKYAELRAMEVNRTGVRRHYLVVLAWSAPVRSAEDRERFDRALSHIKLSVNERTIELARTASTYTEVSLSAPAFAAIATGVREFYYEVTPEQLQLLAAPGPLEFAIGDDEIFRLWEDRRADLEAWMQQVVLPAR